MKRLRLPGYALVAMTIAASTTISAQWLRYPTDGIPRKADGTPNLTAAAPRLPDGKPDLSGLWHAAQARQCKNARGESVPCGIELGGAPPGGNPRRELPGGLLPVPPAAREQFSGSPAARGVAYPRARGVAGK